MDVGASQRAGTSGLIAALDAVAARGGPVLYIAAEKRRAAAASPQEVLYGDGAAAFVLDRDDGVAKFIASRSSTVDFVDHFKGKGREFDYSWEERWIRDEGYLKIVPPVLKGVLAEAKLTPGDIAHFCLPCTLPRVAQSIAKAAGFAETTLRPNLDGQCGDTGTAHPLVMLVHALQEAKPGERILVASFGQGCDALIFEATAALPAMQKTRHGVLGSLKRRKEETNYSRYLAFNDLVKMERGLRAEVDKQTQLSTLYRKKEMLLALVGGKCERCGTVQFPKSNICVNPNCRAMHSQVDQPFSEFTGRVMSFTADSLTYSPDPPALLRHGAVRRGRPDDGGIHRGRCRPGRGRHAHAHGVPHQGGRSGARLHASISGRRRRSAPPRRADNGKRHPGQGRHPRHGVLKIRRALGPRAPTI